MPDNSERATSLMRRGRALEALTLGWNVVGVVISAVAAVTARSVALAGFGLDSLIEIGASTVVLWELAGRDGAREHRALRLIGLSFVALAGYLTVQSSVALALAHRAEPSQLGIVWTAATAVVMFGLAAGKTRTGDELGNTVLTSEGKVTLVDAVLAAAVLLGLILNASLGWWWADPVAGYVLVLYASKEARHVVDPPGPGVRAGS